MEENTQKNAFLEYEADAWFQRNKSVLENYSVDKDKVVSLLKYYNLNTESVLEIGCSAGYRLNGILEVLGKGIKVFGIDPSNAAIAFGKENYPMVNFTKGTADNL